MLSHCNWPQWTNTFTINLKHNSMFYLISNYCIACSCVCVRHPNFLSFTQSWFHRRLSIFVSPANEYDEIEKVHAYNVFYLLMLCYPHFLLTITCVSTCSSCHKLLINHVKHGCYWHLIIETFKKVRIGAMINHFLTLKLQELVCAVLDKILNAILFTTISKDKNIITTLHLT